MGVRSGIRSMWYTSTEMFCKHFWVIFKVPILSIFFQMSGWCAPTKYIHYIPRVPQCLSPRPNWDPPTPSSPSKCVPSPETKGGRHTLLPLRGWGGFNSDDWRKSLALCLLCDVHVDLGHFDVQTCRPLHEHKSLYSEYVILPILLLYSCLFLILSFLYPPPPPPPPTGAGPIVLLRCSLLCIGLLPVILPSGMSKILKMPRNSST